MTTLAQLVEVQASKRPGHTAFTGADHVLTYAELDGAANRVANGLRTSGVGAGDRVAYWSRNSVEFFEILFGAAKLNVPPVALNWRLNPREVAFVLNDSAAKVLVVGESFMDMYAQIADDLVHRPTVLVLGPEGTYSGWRDAQSAEPVRVPCEPGDVALQLYTSGTTGTPKGVMLTHRNWSTAVQAHADKYDLDETSVQILPLPVFHIGGLLLGLLSAVAGATTVVMPEADPVAMLEVVEDRAITHVPIVPALLGPFLDLAGSRGTDLSTIRTVFYGSAPMPESLLRRAMTAMKANYMSGFGMTETTAAVTFLTFTDHRLPHDSETADSSLLRRLRSVGRPAPQAELRIVDPATLQDRETGARGEVLVRGDLVMAGYWKRPEESARALLPEGWLRTGDGGYLDEEGYLFLTDRIKDMIISGGENIYPAELENVLSALPGVREVAVIGISSDRWGETPRAIVVRDPDVPLAEQDVIAHCRQHLASYKCPTSVRWEDALPRTPSGKVMKHLLRERHGSVASTAS